MANFEKALLVSRGNSDWILLRRAM